MDPSGTERGRPDFPGRGSVDVNLGGRAPVGHGHPGRPPDPAHLDPSGTARGQVDLSATGRGQVDLSATGRGQVDLSGTGRGRVDPSLSAPGGAGSTGSLVGRRLGPYSIRRLIAYGGMGAVYEAFHEHLQRRVALKTLLAGHDAPPEDVRRFLNEARTLARLNHPNVVPVFDVGQVGSVRYLAMELVVGQTLYDRICATGPLSEEEAFTVVLHASRGLEHAHAMGILHRDLKPANVLIGEEGAPRLTDFGVAKASGDMRLTASGIALGTPNYMSPEQAQGKNQELDARTDVYGMGAILYECLTGLPPFNEESHMATMQAVVWNELLPPSAHRAGLSRPAEAVVLKCLAKDRDQRYASAEALCEDLARFLRQEPVLASPPPGAGARFFRTVRANALVGLAILALGAACAVVVGLLALPGIRSQQLARAEADAGLLRRARCEAVRHELASDPPPARLNELLASLEWDDIRAAAFERLAPEGEPARRDVVTRGLGDPTTFAGEADPLRAEIKLRQARAAAPGATAQRLLAEAGVLDPAGPAGRRARLELARALYACDDPLARELAVAELKALSAPGEAQGEALLALAQVRADALAWSDVAGLLQAAEDAGAPEEALGQARFLGELARALSGDHPLHADGLVVLGEGSQGAVLVRAHANDLRCFELSAARARELGLAVSEWSLGGQTVQHLASGDQDGDGVDELFLVTHQDGEQTHVGLVQLDTPSGPLSPRPLLQPEKAGNHVKAIAVGDLNGDQRADLAVVYHEQSFRSQVVLGGLNPRAVPLFPPALHGRPGHAFSAVALADLDGDGRDELFLGSSVLGSQTVRVLRLAEDGAAFSEGAPLPLGSPSELRAFRTRQGREGILAVLDYTRDELPRRQAGQAPWFARDGLYLIQEEDGVPAVTGRWTCGPDGPPSAGSLRAARRVSGWTLDLGERTWVARGWFPVEERPWRLELAPLDALGFDANPAPSVALRCFAPPQGLSRILAGELDGDGFPELVLGDRLCGLGQPQVAEAPPAPAAEPPLSLPRRLLRAARQLQHLGAGEQAEAAFVERLQREAPEALATGQALLDGLDGALRRAAAERAESEHAFLRLDPADGRARSERARSLLARTAERAETLAQAPDQAPLLRGQLWAKAAHAWRETGRYPQAAAALDQALAIAELSPDQRVRLEHDRLRLLERLRLAPLQLDFASSAVRDALCVQKPLRLGMTPEGIRLPAGPDTREAALVPLSLGAASPLVLEMDLEVHGSAWQTVVRAGLFDWGSGTELGAFTGFELSLWQPSTRQLGIQPIVAGRAVGPELLLPRYAVRLRLRLEVRSVDGGLCEVGFQAFDAKDQLLFSTRREESDLALGPASLRFLGASSWPIQNDLASREQRHWAMVSSVTLRHATVEGRQPDLAETPGLFQSFRANTLLARGEAARALQLYTQLLEAGSHQAEFLWHRGFARAGSGDPGGVEDLLTVVRQRPYLAVIYLGELAELLPWLERDAALELATQALRAMAADADPVLQAIGRQYLGDLDALHDPHQVNGLAARAALVYLAMRRVDDPQRFDTWLTRYRRALPHGRLPRSSFPLILERPDGPRDDATLRELLTNAEQAAGYRRRAGLLRAQRAFPRRALPLMRLGTYYLEDEDQPGLAEPLFRAALERLNDSQQRGHVLLKLAQSQALSGRLEQALEGLEQAVAAGVGATRLGGRLEEVFGEDPRYRALVKRAQGKE